MDPSRETLTILFPMWNEEAIVPATVQAALEVGESLVGDAEIAGFEVLVVDDASTDLSGEIVDKIAAEESRVRIVHHDENRGVGGALRTGFDAASGDLVLYTHADLPCDLAELERAVRLLRSHRADLVSAYRHNRLGEGPRQYVYSVAWNGLVRTAFGLGVRDVNFPFKLCRRSMLDQLDLASDKSFVDAELLLRAERSGFRIIQFGVDYFPRKRGVSTLSSPPDILTMVGDLLSSYREIKRIRPLPGAVIEGQESDLRVSPRSRGRLPVATRTDVGSRLLIVNADDFGLTTGISNGIIQAHREGIVTSTSVLAVGPAFERTGPLLGDVPTLGVGVHLAAVGEDPPLLSAAEIPTLVDRRGRLPGSWRQFTARAFAGRVDPDDLRREFAAQFERVDALGVAITHLDTHQHLHLWPIVREVVLELAGERGIAAVRVPYGSGGPVVALGTDRLAVALERRADEIGVAYPEASAGLDPSGRLDGAALARALDRLSATGHPTLELWAHPGERRDPERVRYRWGYRWGDELAVLTGPAARYVVARQGFTLGTFRGSRTDRVSALTPVPPAGRDALAVFADAPITMRLHVHVRWRTCPLAEVAARVPAGGAVLDIGCGHGLFASYLALDAHTRRVVGVDLDDRKLADASRVTERVHERGGTLALELAPGGAVPDGPWDAITVVDVLYLLPADRQRDLVERAAARLAPGGRLLVKEMAPEPAWKARWNRIQETLAVRVVGFTASESTGFTFVPPAEVLGWLEAAGLEVEEVPLDRGYLHPHHLLVATRRSCEPGADNSVDPAPGV